MGYSNRMKQAAENRLYYKINQSEQGVNMSVQSDSVSIILIHGLAASLSDWNDLIPDLNQAGYKSFALDLPGHGNSSSSGDKNQFTSEYVFQSFCDWVDMLALQPPLILVGHSLGGYLAIRYCLLHPERIKALVLCDPFYTLKQLPFLLNVAYKYSIVDTSLIGFFPEWLIRLMVDLASFSIRNGFELSSSVRQQTANDYKRARPEIYNIFNTVQDLSPVLSSITQPTLILWGAKDKTLGVFSFEKMGEKIPGAIGVAIAGAGHVPHQSHSIEFNRYVLEFIDRVIRTQPG